MTGVNGIPFLKNTLQHNSLSCPPVKGMKMSLCFFAISFAASSIASWKEIVSTDLWRMLKLTSNFSPWSG